MRLHPLAVAASLVLAPGCIWLAVPPVLGAVGGAVVAGSKDPASHPSAAGHVLVGGLVGLVIEAAIVVLVVSNNPDILDLPDPE
jgi:hypothetical protein